MGKGDGNDVVVIRRNGLGSQVQSGDSDKDPVDVRERVRFVLQEMLSCLVAEPSQTTVRVSVGSKTTLYEIDTVSADFGRIVGSKGRTIESMRCLVAAMCGSAGFRAVLQIKDEARFVRKT
ncbi:KH domain-containing protein [Bdellovibrio bacteriovorus]|uniref:KH domain-containing protein n=1 Tax=Bdellovibrio bacteriovorus TaxID=959 RepID=UPI00067FC5D8|nr:KH domain-containing protein [Bdellovibrio bacteriovorus]BEV69156.1 hypothetical protein Bb109J_c2576 [Bdellovibrio bacteriovorus]